MEKNDVMTVEITGLTSEGEGIARVDAFPLFIKDTCIGDTVECCITKLKKTYGYARLLKLIEPSEDRTEVRCPVARVCGGCQIQHMNYAAQLDMKTEKVRQNLKRIGGFKDIEPENCLGMTDPWRYRNKAQIPFGTGKDGQIVSGFYAEHSHRIIDSEDCCLSFEETAVLTKLIREWMKEEKISPYNEETQQGVIRHVLMRKGFKTGQIMVCVIVNRKKLPRSESLLNRLQTVPGFTTLCYNVNMNPGNTILTPETHTVYGPGVIEDKIGEISFEISANSFFQVNPYQTEILYGKALEFAGLTGEETVWDLYCGIGTISLFLAQKAKKVYGVEIVPQAVENARGNAIRNGFTNAEFYLGKAEEVLPSYYAAHPEETVDCIVVDPPRKGCDSALLDTIIAMAPKRMVYVSCDSATLARDLKILSEGGFRVEKVQPVDMFPQTAAVETVVLLSGEKVDGHIDIDLDVEKLEGKSGAATYAEIKAYIKEKYGFNVTSLYIGQIKDKAGVKDRKNYNTGSGKGRVPTCPTDKEEAIMDAFRHFGLI